MTRFILIFLSAAAFVIADQATKHLAETNISAQAPLRVLSFLNLVNVRNTGAAFGILSGLGNKFFIIISVLAIVFIVILLWKPHGSKVSDAGLVLILSGALGNLIDRALYGYVRDFIDLHAGGLHWPAFNLADSCLTVGILLVLSASFLKKERA